MSEPVASAAPPIIIAGMHRSGTSLTASILQQAGVFIGDSLLVANPGNPHGYFEDAEFYRLHKRILSAQGIDPNGWTIATHVEVPESFWQEAQALCDRRLQTHRLWGWKEPRTTLFLHFWKQVLPQAKFIFPYRSPWEVIDSLFMRGDAVFDEQPNLAADVWLAYNRAVWEFYQQYPDDCFLFHCGLLQTDEVGFVETIRQQWNLPLTVPAQRLFQPGAMHNSVHEPHHVALLAQYSTEILSLYETLQRCADMPPPSTDPIVPSDWSASALRDWQRAARRQQELRNLQTHMQEVTAALQTHLQATQAALEQSQAAATHWRLTVEAMEANRLWKLRNAWVRLKQQVFPSQR